MRIRPRPIVLLLSLLAGGCAAPDRPRGPFDLSNGPGPGGDASAAPAAFPDAGHRADSPGGPGGSDGFDPGHGALGGGFSIDGGSGGGTRPPAGP